MKLICWLSSATFRESHDGRMMTATFDLPGIKKNQVHVSYRGHYLIVDWETVKITEHEEGGKIVRDRKEKTYSRTLPIPEGTRVSLCFGVWFISADLLTSESVRRSSGINGRPTLDINLSEHATYAC
jgi:Hsp20/alpha crystallin family